MSTPGKVLTVLILLVMVVWLVMMSAVSQLNFNHADKVKKQKDQLDKLIVDTTKANTRFLELTDATKLQQENTDRDVRILLEKIASIERRKSTHTESLTRVQDQLKDYLAALEKAKTNKTTRETEKAKGEEDLAKTKDEIAKAQALNAELRTQLAQLQDEFKRLLAENAAALSKLKEKAPATKPASGRRVSPAS